MVRNYLKTPRPTRQRESIRTTVYLSPSQAAMLSQLAAQQRLAPGRLAFEALSVWLDERAAQMQNAKVEKS